MTLDEATAALLAQLAAAGTLPLHEMTPRDARAMMAADGPAAPAPEMAAVRDALISVSGGHVPVRVLTPGGRPRAVIVYYHGGGWVLGALDEVDALGRQLAHRTGSVVVLVDYRLAPEFRFPIAVDDSWAALQWTAEHLTELADGPLPLIVAGDSAGGNLAAVMAHRAKAAGGPPIAVQVLAYPVTDCDLDTTSYRDPANQLMVSRDDMIWFWDHYAPVPARPRSSRRLPAALPRPVAAASRGDPHRRARRSAGRGRAVRDPAGAGRRTGAAQAVHGTDARVLHHARRAAGGRRRHGLRRGRDRGTAEVGEEVRSADDHHHDQYSRS